MDRISGLPDEVLVKILSFAPTKVAVSTSILSKRWEFLWMWLTKLEFGGKLYSESEFKSFLDRNLSLHRAPVIESFCLKLSNSVLKPEDIRMWVVVVLSRYVRELEIYSSCYQDKQNILPSSLYTCKSLVILKLNGGILMDVPRMVCLPSLKTLVLKGVNYFKQGSLQRLLSNCPVLEDLVVNLCHHDNMGKFIVIVPSLQRLSLYIGCKRVLDEFVIDTPSLEYFKLVDRNYDSHSCLIENMPKLREAYVDVRSTDLQSLIGSITSVKRLIISSKAMFGDGYIFNRLERLTLHVLEENPSNLLSQFLKDSPNLQKLEYFSELDDSYENMRMFPWNQPSIVPECLLSSLQKFTWSQYLGRTQDRDIAVYILKNACCLRNATIDSYTCLVPELEMIKELTRSSRASTTCELNFS
ncbi:putative FBD domain, leucine-rich repeat domain superfamily, F-box-like domain superfamily [Arabidopsis thaliana]